jgi:hypothetical protein
MEGEINMSNFNETVGIRYGVISPHSISSWSLDEIYQNGTDPIYEELKNDLIDPIRKHLNNFGFSVGQIDEVLDPLIDNFNESYESDGSGIMDYSDKEYDLHVSGDNFGIFVMRSPYYTWCKPCSPCAPGAGDLDNPADTHTFMIEGDKQVDYPGYSEKTLCLGHEWFDQDNDQYSRKIPHRVFRVSDDTEVLPGDQS